MVVRLFDQLEPEDTYCLCCNVERVDPGVVVFKDGTKEGFDNTIYDWEVIVHD